MHRSVLLAVAALRFASAHFVLQIPPTIGLGDGKQATFPCGGPDPARPPASVSPSVFPWAISGSNVGVMSTNASVTWDLKAALLTDTTKWVPLVEKFAQTGAGEICFPKIPAPAEWEGKEGVLQVVQHGPDGDSYQCAAIKFVPGGPDAVPAGCTNAAGVSVAPIIPATAQPPQPPSSSSTNSAATTSAAATATEPASTASAATSASAAGPPSSGPDTASSTATATATATASSSESARSSSVASSMSMNMSSITMTMTMSASASSTVNVSATGSANASATASTSKASGAGSVVGTMGNAVAVGLVVAAFFI